MDYPDISERAAIIEFDGGYSRFEAETRTASEYGKKRWELFHAVSKRNPEQAKHQGQSTARDTKNDMSAMQPHPQKQARYVLVGFVSAGWGGLEMLALFVSGGGLL